MNIETLKSITLTILIAFSLFLTVSLWYYQPNLEPIDDKNVGADTNIEEGVTNNLSELVVPDRVILHKQDRFYSFRNQLDRERFLSEVKNWTINGFSSRNFIPQKGLLAELHFPTAIPSSTIQNLFTLSEGAASGIIPEMNFKEVYFVNDNNEKVEVFFKKEDEEGYMVTAIQSVSALQRLDMQKINEPLNEQLLFDAEGVTERIFVPADARKIPDYVLLATDIDKEPLISTLFTERNNVRVSSTSDNGKRYYDSESEMEVPNGDKYMRFRTATSTELSNMTMGDVLVQSIDFVNDHTGWTNKFQLTELTDRQATYRMHFQGIPLLNWDNLTTIHIEYVQQQVANYDRPLISIEGELDNSDGDEDNGNVRQLPSGETVTSYLVNNYDEDYLGRIEDVKIGYRLVSPAEASVVYYVQPYWHIKINGGWEQFEIDELSNMRSSGKGGAGLAMGPN
ncbi:YycH family regulatory protein [Thalassobacillus hwangdonensis]|uniref:YycH family regulatory protein n=1 Tax=Thalassobacillus hwangdonensis TaxID=546108 RepID=A0ABW3L021_9BACI